MTIYLDYFKFIFRNQRFSAESDLDPDGSQWIISGIVMTGKRDELIHRSLCKEKMNR
ncbi:MAG: hypothetical protein ACFFDN_26920 [Candidatus Hodarchaeota archaeon]